MTVTVLVVTTAVLVLLMVGLSIVLVGREWLRGRRQSRLKRDLERHASLISRLSQSSGDEFEGAFRQLAALLDPVIQEAILNRASEEAGAETSPLLVRAHEDLSIADRYIVILEESPKWEKRARAAERLGQIGSARAVAVLLRVIRNIKDEDEDVRGAALRALGRIRDPRCLPDLIEALGNTEASLPPRIAEIIFLFGADAVIPLIEELRNLDSNVRRMWAAEILGWLGDELAAVPLMESLGDVSPEVRAKAAGALGKIADLRAVDRLLEMLLSDPIPFVRTRVAKALGELGQPKVIDHLIHVLSDPEWWVRIRAIEALEQIGESSSEALLVALEDDDKEVRRHAAGALERMGYVREGIAAFDREGFRADIYRVLLKIGQAGVTEVLFDRIQHARGEALKLLVRLTGAIGDPAAGPILRDVLSKTDDWKLRSRVVEALGEVGCRESIPDLLSCLSDPADWVRRAAVQALSMLGAEAFAGDLMLLLKDPLPATRRAVLKVVAQMDWDRATSVVEGMLDDPAPEVRAEALSAVAIRKLQGCEAKVRGLLRDTAEEVRREAALALSVVGTRDSVDSILRAAVSASDPLIEALTAALVWCHKEPFSELLARAPDSLSREQVLVLLEAACKGAGEGRLAFVSAHLGAPESSTRRSATFALRGFGPGELVELLQGPLRDPDEQVRVAAVTVAALGCDEALFAAVEKLAVDPHETVRFHVALALGVAKQPGFRETLLTLGRDHDASVRAGAALALSLQNDPALIPTIRDLSLDAELARTARQILVRNSPDPLISRVVSEALDQNVLETRLFLGESRFALEKDLVQHARAALTVEERIRALKIGKVVATGQSYTSVLAILKNDPAPEVRSSALDLLLAIRRDAEMARIVGTTLMDPHPDLRVKAARALGEMELPEAMESLVHALDTPNRSLREEVTSALSKHMERDPERAEALMERIPSTQTRKLGMVWLLGKTRRKGAMKILLRYLADEDGDVRAAAVGALAKYSFGIVSRHLKDSLSDPNGRVRAATVNALARGRTAEWERAMEKMLADPDSFVRQRAAIALYWMESTTISQRIRSIGLEPEELQPVWAAIGLVSGDLLPTDISEFPTAAGFVQELFPLAEAETAIRKARNPRKRLIAFRVLQVQSAEAVKRATEVLVNDPDAGVRHEAVAALEQSESV